MGMNDPGTCFKANHPRVLYTAPCKSRIVDRSHKQRRQVVLEPVLPRRTRQKVAVDTHAQNRLDTLLPNLLLSPCGISRNWHPNLFIGVSVACWNWVLVIYQTWAAVEQLLLQRWTAKYMHFCHLVKHVDVAHLGAWGSGEDPVLWTDLKFAHIDALGIGHCPSHLSSL